MSGIVLEKQRYCRLDSKPIDQSKVYPLLKRFLGKKVANRLTYEDW